MFGGYSFSLRLPDDTPLAPSTVQAIEQHGGRVLPSDLPLSYATHVVVQHQSQPACAEALQQRKTAVTSFWVLACAEVKHVLPCTHPLHKPFPSSKVQGASGYGVSITAFQGMQRQILLDLLRCLGVDVQKQMRLNTATHLIAQDVDDKTSSKLQHVRKPEWAAKISIVNCKWVYDCVIQWRILPAGEYEQNCSESEAMAWQGASADIAEQQLALPPAPLSAGAAVAAHSPAALPSAGTIAQTSGQTSTAAPKQPQFQHLVASCAQPFTSPVVSAGAQQKQQASSGRWRSSTGRTALAPAGLGAGLSTGKQLQGVHSLQAKLPQAPAVAAAATAAVEEVGSHGRESLGGTQGAITGLTNMALQKLNEEGPPDYAGVYAGTDDTQGLRMQIADAEAATARLVVQMAEQSPDQQPPAERSLPLQLHKGLTVAGVQSANKQQQQQQREQQHSSDRENIPQLQRHTGKRGSNARPDAVQPANALEAGAKEQHAKRQKVSNTAVVSAMANKAVAGGKAAGHSTQPSDAQAIVGCAVKQRFEEGVFQGIVKSYNKKHKWYLIEYEDGDRQELTWQELQPILLPASPNVEPLKKPKRKLQRADTHMRDAQPKAAADPAGDGVLPISAPTASAAPSRKAAKPVQARGRLVKTASRSQQLLADEDVEAEEAVLAEEPIRADTPAGPRADAGSGPGSKPSTSNTPYSANKKPRALVALGSMHTSEQQACSSQLANIGVAFVAHKQCSRWRPEITHVVLPSLVRSVKSLAGMAAGRWILHADFVEASASAEALIDPEEYELDNGTAISPCAPKHWRERHEIHRVGAFHQLHILIYGACIRPGPDKNDVAMIIQAGDGTVVKCEKVSSVLSKAISRGLQLAVMSSDKEASDPVVKQLVKAKVPCASVHFLIEWLAHPQTNLTEHMLFDSEIAWSSELEAAAEARMAPAKPQPMSPHI